MSFEEDSVRWHRAASRIFSIQKSNDDVFFTNINVILDEMNSLDFSSPLVTSSEEACQVLSKCCTLVPGNGTNDLLSTKLCQLISNLIARQKVIITQSTCDAVLEFLTGSIQCCQKWALINHLRSLDAVLSCGGPMCSKFIPMLTAQAPEGLLTGFIDDPDWDVDIKCKAISCVANICSKGPGGTFVDEEHLHRVFEIILNIVRFMPSKKMDQITHYRLVLAALKSFQTVQVALPVVKKEFEQPLLAALKNCIFCGLPGYHPNFPERSSLKQPSEMGIHADDLSSINLNAVSPKSLSYQNAAALTNKKKKKRTGHKNRGYTPHTPNYAPPTGPKFRRDYSSVDALMPSFAKTSISKDSQPRPAHPETKSPSNAEKLKGNESDGKPETEVQEATVMQETAGHTSGSEGVSATSSDSDFSDSEAGQAARLRSLTTKVRQNALSCLETVVKGMEKKVLFGYWSSFIPDSSSGTTWSLFTTILRDPSPRARAGGVAVLCELLDRSRQFLAAADDRDERSAVLSARPFTSFSGRLGATVHEIHRHLLQAVLAETSSSTKLHLMKCLSVLILNSPYNRLRAGLLTRVVNQLRPMLTSNDFNFRVSALTCIGMVVSVHAPLDEVIELMKPSIDTKSLETTGYSTGSKGSRVEKSTETTGHSTGSVERREEKPMTTNGDSTGSEGSRVEKSTETTGHSTGSVEGREEKPTATNGDSTKSKQGDIAEFSSNRTEQEPTTSATTSSVIQDGCPWLVQLCADTVVKKRGREGQPLVVRVEALQVLIAFVRNYFSLISPFTANLTRLVCECLDEDQAIALLAIKFLQELGKTMYSFLPDQANTKDVQVVVSKDQLLQFWLGLLTGPLVTILQGTNSKLISSAIDCLSNIGASIFEVLPEDKRIMCITMLLGFCIDDDKNVKASSVRAVGVLVLYPSLREDVLYVADTANAVLTCMEDQTLAVRMRAAWSLGNLSDTLVANKSSQDSTFIEDFSDMLLLRLLELAIKASEDHEKVKSNAVRALGNFLNYVKPSTLEKRGFTRGVEKAVRALIANVGTGLMKVRWNACYAIGNVFRNTSLPIGTATWTHDIYTALTNVIKECKNFKVRINAVLSLSIPVGRHCYGDTNQFLGIIDALFKAIESSNTLTEFSEFKYRDNLREQLCNTLCHLVSLIAVEDLEPLLPILEQNKAVLQLLTDHITSVSLSQEGQKTVDNINEDSEQLFSRGTSKADQLLNAQAAQKHVFKDLSQEIPSVKILCDALTIREPIPTVRTGPAMTNE